MAGQISMMRIQVIALLIALCISNIEGGTYKVLSLNMANYNDHPYWDQRAEEIAQIIASAEPDLVALQEPRFDTDVQSTMKSYQNAAEQVLYLLNFKYNSFQGAYVTTQPLMHYPTQASLLRGSAPVPSESRQQLEAAVFADLEPHAQHEIKSSTDPQMVMDTFVSTESAYRYPIASQYAPYNITQYWEGLTLISRRSPFLQTGTRFLTLFPDCPDSNVRGTQYTLQRTTNTTSPSDFYLFNTHFGLNSVCQSENADETISYIASLGTPQSFKLLVGDFNTTPSSPAINAIIKAGFVDLWALLNPTLPGYTHPSNAPSSRIDYMFALPSLSKFATSIQLIGTKPNSQNIYPSDHFGLLATFTF